MKTKAKRSNAGPAKSMSPSNSTTKGNAGGRGYTGIRDMFDGGGPGASGKTFRGGGLISDIGNSLGGPHNLGRAGLHGMGMAMLTGGVFGGVVGHMMRNRITNHKNQRKYRK